MRAPRVSQPANAALLALRVAWGVLRKCSLLLLGQPTDPTPPSHPPTPLSAELLVDLPLAYFVGPISTTPGQLPLILDLERKR